jgi:catechol 2,3-dioxygenase-like lactoylglutathione lyase family enzyme
MEWQFLVPNLAVRDVSAAQRWYQETLGLRAAWIWENNFGSVAKDHVELFLFESDDPKTAICSLFVDDVDEIYERCRRSGCIASELELKPWGVREFSIEDPDGNMFRIGHSEGEPSQPEKFTVMSEAE